MATCPEILERLDSFWYGNYQNSSNNVLTCIAILFPVTMHSILAAFIVYVNQHINSDFNLPSSIVSLVESSICCTIATENNQIPSLSIVVGLMLVFRNQTAYSRFWNGRCHLNTVTTAVRCLSRQILVLVPAPTFSGLSSLISSDSLLPSAPRLSRESINGDKVSPSGETVLSPADQAKTVETVKILIAMLYTIKNHLRAEWGVALSPGTSLTADGQEANTDEYKDLLPPGLKGYEHRGLGLTLELATFVEKYIQTGVKKYDQFPPSPLYALMMISGNGSIMQLLEACFPIWMVLFRLMEAWKSYGWCQFLWLICKFPTSVSSDPCLTVGL
jgi:hypothetical protein